jgi:hypothetical protein
LREGPSDRALSRQTSLTSDGGVDGTRTDDVHADLARSKFDSGDLRKTDQGRLAGRVDAGRGHAVVDRGGAIEYDRSPLAKQRKLTLQREECTLEVCTSQLVEQRLIRVFDRCELGDPGVFEQNVDVTEALANILERLVDVGAMTPMVPPPTSLTAFATLSSLRPTISTI